jgi:hypothetical protein
MSLRSNVKPGLDICVRLPKLVTFEMLPLVGYGTRYATVKKLMRCCAGPQIVKTGKTVTLILTYYGPWSYDRENKKLALTENIAVMLKRGVDATLREDFW